MKKTLLALLFVPCAIFAQGVPQTFMGQLYNGPGGVVDGINFRSYEIVTSPTALNHTPTAGELTWNFQNLTAAGGATYAVTTPTPAEISAFPGTDRVLSATFPGGQSSQFYLGNNGGGFTAAATPEFVLTYTNQATMGSFPLSFGYNNSDTVAGTFSYQTYNGTFSGTITTTVDAQGTLMTYAFNEPRDVIRMKVVQTLNLSYPPFGNVGTFTQTVYHYYENDVLFLWPQFRSTNTVLSVPLLGLNENDTILEQQTQVFLGNPENAKASVAIYPNPVKELLNLQSDAQIQSISIADISGKIIRKIKNPGAQIDLSDLKTGIYIAEITSEKGNSVQKIAKQ
ncbi:T9SS type A sorting domain-containing protein [Flavobacterium sp.]|uniref:T9SS type A sorting domain-containing protein n=1 Tax=Flavobacterium sp. TaxID=239 RepID=UPI001211908C|nr:T9SS type A sorting domain-containing protein [Flavobacterium sp.]RZJ71394.1 MAG: T9SS type A sorting domain-containing protein [Flavobacterium sp.]